MVVTTLPGGGTLAGPLVPHKANPRVDASQSERGVVMRSSGGNRSASGLAAQLHFESAALGEAKDIWGAVAGGAATLDEVPSVRP